MNSEEMIALCKSIHDEVTGYLTLQSNESPADFDAIQKGLRAIGQRWVDTIEPTPVMVPAAELWDGEELLDGPCIGGVPMLPPSEARPPVYPEMFYRLVAAELVESVLRDTLFPIAGKGGSAMHLSRCDRYAEAHGAKHGYRPTPPVYVAMR